MVSRSQRTSRSPRWANIAHGVRPPLTARLKRPSPAVAAAARSAISPAPRRATAVASSYSSTSMAGLDRLLGVAAELLAHRRQHLVAEHRAALGLEARRQRRQQHRSGDALVDGGQRRPPALARVGHPAAELLEVG